jgi:hypothetical protein
MINDKESAYQYLRNKAQGTIQANEIDDNEVRKYFTSDELEELSFNQIQISDCKKACRK